MSLEIIIKTLIWIHVITGTTALIAGMVSMIAKKGGPLHLKSGLIFFWSLLISDIISLLVAVSPGHENTFLFTIGVFTLYLILGGYMAIRYKQQEVNLFWDKVLSGTMLITGIGMILYPIVQFGRINIILTVFGTVGIFFSLIDFKRFQNREHLRKKYLQLHLTKMIGGFIASVTAFIVANGFINGLIGWLSPGFLGGFIIFYWIRKLNRLYE